MNINNYFYILFSVILLNLSSNFSMGSYLELNFDPAIILNQDDMVKNQLKEMQENGNEGANLLHAAVHIEAFDWIKYWVNNNINKPDFKETITKLDSFMLTPRKIAICKLNLKIANFIASYENN